MRYLCQLAGLTPEGGAEHKRLHTLHTLHTFLTPNIFAGANENDGDASKIYGPEKVRNVCNVCTPAPFPADWKKRFTPEQLERLAIRTVDGGMSDTDALTAEGLTDGGGRNSRTSAARRP